jgi:uncharacterized protein
MNNHHWLALQVKPVGDFCNLNCIYCYNSKNIKSRDLMSEEVLDVLLGRYIKYSPKHLTFSWHGGEPLTAGLTFYENLEKKLNKMLNSGQSVFHMMQTNGTLVNTAFAKLFKRNNFKIGVSLDGSEKIHSFHRMFNNNLGSYKQVMRGIKILRENGIEPSIICTVSKKSFGKAREILDFLVKNNFYSLSFSPVSYVGDDSRRKDLVLSSEEWLEFLRGQLISLCHCVLMVKIALIGCL